MSEAITMPTNATATPAPDRLAVVGALAWRFLRRSTHSVLPLLGIIWGVPTFLYLMVLLVDAESVRHFAAEDPSIKRLYFLMTMITVPALPLTELIKIRSLYTLPLATRRIVNIQLGLGLLVIILVQLATVVYYKVVFEDPVPVFGSEPIPIFGPLLLLIPTGLIFAGLAAFLVDARLWKVPVAIAILGFFLAQGVGRFEEAAWIHSSDKWFTPSPTELLVLLQSAFLGYLAIRHAADRDRRGDTRPWADVKELWHRLVAWLDSRRMSQAAVARESLFPSASAAHRSYEWQTRGLVVPIMAALGGLLSLIGAWFHPPTGCRAASWPSPDCCSSA